ncbi:uncharacterized protein RHOBADRAFT_43711 [Rhodotorula graminis WP1]|uniref:MYND-type domain-containing protein n=1 Tax=Rhodotorula graminis (strain WP1) TaxID=578459 RepID=A0A194S3Q3_RHOGW|nr:uncharacterized protein RHOBADRAFT_43711 [Rhodotorula graminis WP1]KPV75222.1 hypothetical protein RHOBADRAFT_43711 [Rhodotorula graminis WP1]
MAINWDETCLVCGTETKQRCSKCAEAGISLGFCSPAHQQLAWNVHKRVCGPGKANPFTWPLLTKDESREIIEHMDESTGHLIDHSSDRSTVAKALLHFWASRATKRSITKGAPEPPDDKRTRHKLQQINLIVRAHEWARTESPHIRWNAPPADPFMSLPYWDLYSACEWPFQRRHGAEPWRARYLHYMLFFEERIDKARFQPVFCAPNENVEMARIVARLHTFVDTHIAPVYPLVGAQLYESLAKHENVLRILGVSPPS